MFSYLLLDIVFLGIASFVFALTRNPKYRQGFSRVLFVGGIMLSAMLVFDSYLTILPIVTYNRGATLGLRLGSIPIEDIAYLIVAVLLTPRLYSFFSDYKQT